MFTQSVFIKISLTSKKLSFLGYRHSKEFNNLLSSPKTTLEEVLDSEDVICEFRNKNDKLCGFLNHKRISQLINYIIQMPPDNSSQGRGYRYPFYACEILSDEQTFISETFFPNYQKGKDENELNGFVRKIDISSVDECEGQFLKVKISMPEVMALDNQPKHSLLDQLFSFLNTDTPVNEVLAGYFSQVVICLINLKQSEMCEIIYCTNLIDQMLKQLHLRSIAEIILKIINIDSFKEIEKKEVIIEKREKLVNDLFQIAIIKDLNHGDYEILDNISYIFNEIINEYKTIFHGQELVNFIIQGKRIKFLLERTTSFVLFNYLMQYFLQDKHIALCSTNILLGITTNIFKDFKKNVQKETQLEIKELVEQYAYQFDFLMEFIAIENPDSMRISNGSTIRSFGINKLKLLESISHVLKSEDPEIIKQFTKEQTFIILGQLMYRYQWNNILHSIIQKICTTLFKKKSIQIPCKIIIDKFLQLSKELHDGLYRKGFLGHLTLIGQDFEQFQTLNNEDFRFQKPGLTLFFNFRQMNGLNLKINIILKLRDRLEIHLALLDPKKIASIMYYIFKQIISKQGACQFQLIDVKQLELQNSKTEDDKKEEEDNNSDSDSSNSGSDKGEKENHDVDPPQK